MNILRLSRENEGMFRNLHPSDPLWLIMTSYGSATEFMENDTPSTPEILSAMHDLIDLMFADSPFGEDGDVRKLTAMEVEAILFENGFDFINTVEMRENSSQHYIGGEIIGL